MKYHCLCTNQQPTFFILLDTSPKDIKGFGRGEVCSGFLFAPHQPVFSLMPWGLSRAALTAAAENWAGIFIKGLASGRKSAAQTSETGGRAVINPWLFSEALVQYGGHTWVNGLQIFPNLYSITQTFLVLVSCPQSSLAAQDGLFLGGCKSIYNKRWCSDVWWYRIREVTKRSCKAVKAWNSESWHWKLQDCFQQAAGMQLEGCSP